MEAGVSVVLVASVGVVCSVVVAWGSGVLAACVSPEACVEVEDVAVGACAGAWRAFAVLAL